MKRIALLLSVPAALFFVPAAPAKHQHRNTCRSHACKVRVGRKMARAEARRYGPHQSLVFTHYSGACDGQTDSLADGHNIYESGLNKHFLASTVLPMHAHIHFDRPVYGSRDWIVRDTGGHADLYVPNCEYGSHGWPGNTNPSIGFRMKR